MIFDEVSRYSCSAAVTYKGHVSIVIGGVLRLDEGAQCFDGLGRVVIASRKPMITK